MLKLYFLFLSIVYFFCVSAQNKTNILVSEPVQKNLNEMKLNVYIPKDFSMVSDGGFECFEKNKPLNLAFTCLNNKLISKSGECIMFISIDRLYNSEDSIFFSKISPNNRPFNSNQIHINNLKRQISNVVNDRDNWREKIHYVEPREAKENFNADSVLYFHTEVTNSLIYEGKFNNIISLMIQKKDRGFVNVIILYTKGSGLDFQQILNLLKNNIYYYG